MATRTTVQTDRQLLERFVAQADEDAFAKLVHRHGSMVLGVCRQILRQEEDAEDAFQATFLVLCRKAGSIRSAEALPNWLYGVARRLAARSKFAVARRRTREVALVNDLTPNRAPDSELGDRAPALHEEIGRLPDKYRVPFVLCYLQGKTNEEAARQLGCPPGTVFSRLARARERLRARLTRRGLVLSTSALATTLSALSQEASAAAPLRLLSTTVRRAIPFGAGKTDRAADIPAEIRELAEWGLNSLARRGFHMTVAAAVLLGLSTMTGGLILGLRGHRGAEKPTPEQQFSERLQGTWKIQSWSVDGDPAPPATMQTTVIFEANRMTFADVPGVFRIDVQKNPMQMDWTSQVGTVLEIFEFRGDTLVMCIRTPSANGPQAADRPADFTPGSGRSLMVFERLKP